MPEEEVPRKARDSGPPSPASGHSAVDPVSQYVRGRLDKVTEHINAHLRYYRMVPWALGAMGVAFLLRSANTRVPLRRIRQVSEIPSDLVRDNRRLSGVVKATGWNTIGVWHVPGWRWVVRWGTRPPESCSSTDLLTIQFSGVAVSDPTAAAAWLNERLLGKKVWLTLLDHTSQSALDQKAVECIVHSRKGRWKWRKACVNEELLAAGLGSVREVTGVREGANYTGLVSGLVRSEETAKAKGQGVWHGTEHVTTWNKLKNIVRRRK